MSSDDSSFEEIIAGDLESKAGSVGSREEDEEDESTTEVDGSTTEEEEQKVVVELPPELLSGDSTTAKEADGSKVPPGCNQTRLDHESTASSSFIPVKAMGSMKIKESDGSTGRSESSFVNVQPRPAKNLSSAGFYSTDISYDQVKGGSSETSLSSWQTSYYGNNPTNDGESSVAASSTISGFDLISISGESKRRCKRCSLFNEDKDGICGCCGLALVANPCLDIDEQIARSLQHKEEDLAFQILQTQERKRKMLSKTTLLTRSEFLSNEIASFVEGCKLVEERHIRCGFDTLPLACLTVLASRFIDIFDKSGATCVRLCYYFSAKQENRMTQIRQDGFGPSSCFSDNVEVAANRRQVPSDRRYKKLPSHFRMLLSEIPEDKVISKEEEIECLGWIAAIVQTSDLEERETAAPSGNATLITIGVSSQALPLVCFDAALRKNDAIRRLMNGLQRVCQDYFNDDFASSGAAGLPDEFFDPLHASGTIAAPKRPKHGHEGPPSSASLSEEFEKLTHRVCVTKVDDELKACSPGTAATQDFVTSAPTTGQTLGQGSDPAAAALMLPATTKRNEGSSSSVSLTQEFQKLSYRNDNDDEDKAEYENLSDAKASTEVNIASYRTLLQKFAKSPSRDDYKLDSQHDSNLQTEEETYVVDCPPGKLGLTVDNPEDGPPVVHTVNVDSFLFGQVNVGDRLVSVDEVDVQAMSPVEVSILVRERCMNNTRKLIFMRTKQNSKIEQGINFKICANDDVDVDSFLPQDPTPEEGPCNPYTTSPSFADSNNANDGENYDSQFLAWLNGESDSDSGEHDNHETIDHEQRTKNDVSLARLAGGSSTDCCAEHNGADNLQDKSGAGGGDDWKGP